MVASLDGLSRLAAFVVALGVVGCARPPKPVEPNQRMLYRDLRRLVSLTAAAGWKIDRLEVEELLPVVLSSVCRVRQPQRDALLDWVDEQIRASGGSVREQWIARGKKLHRVDRLLELTRIRMVLARAIGMADRDCPFWLEEKELFLGRQTIDDRWVFHFGGGGKGMLVDQGGRTDVSFGGAGRFLLGRAFGSRWALLTGIETGASASFPKDDTGERGTLVFGIDAVVPVVARYRNLNTYWELEGGPLAHFTEVDRDPDYGLHVGVSFGGTASLRRFFFPGAAFGISYEQTFPGGDEPSLRTVKIGFRVAIDLPF